MNEKKKKMPAIEAPGIEKHRQLEVVKRSRGRRVRDFCMRDE